jgi:hypothetical protein
MYILRQLFDLLLHYHATPDSRTPKIILITTLKQISFTTAKYIISYATNQLIYDITLVFAVLFPLVHFTENHETLQHLHQQGQLLDEHALGSDFILHQGAQKLHFLSDIIQQCYNN